MHDIKWAQNRWSFNHEGHEAPTVHRSTIDGLEYVITVSDNTMPISTNMNNSLQVLTKPCMHTCILFSAYQILGYSDKLHTDICATITSTEVDTCKWLIILLHDSLSTLPYRIRNTRCSIRYTHILAGAIWQKSLSFNTYSYSLLTPLPTGSARTVNTTPTHLREPLDTFA